MKTKNITIDSIEGSNPNLFEKTVTLAPFDKHVPNGRIVNLKKGETYRPSKNHLGYILSGALRISFTNRSGTKKIIRVLGPNNLVGDAYFVLKRDRFLSFEVVEDAKLCLFDRAYFERILCEDDEVLMAMITSLAVHAEAIGRQLEEALDRDPRFKVARFLYNFIRKEGIRNERGNLEYSGKLSQNDIAMYIGINRVCVTREIEKLKVAHILSNEQGKYVVLNEPALRSICEENI